MIQYNTLFLKSIIKLLALLIKCPVDIYNKNKKKKFFGLNPVKISPQLSTIIRINLNLAVWYVLLVYLHCVIL